jgi:murein DD-endopeptidase MepM/ murein hydrolase activator NlpD
LEGLQEQIDDLEQQLRELDETREAVLSQLGAKAHIPPVNALLKEIYDSQDTLMASVLNVQINSDERSSSFRTTVTDLEDYFALLSAKLRTQLVCFTNLQSYVARIGPYVKNYPTIWPVLGKVSSGFGYRSNPMGGGGSENHQGLDIQVAINTSVRATGGGIVREAGYSGDYGYMVVIDHGFGLKTAYAHNTKILVTVGQRVERGDIIAKSGSTGRSTGPHVHYEVRVNNVAVNPTKYILE